MHERNRMRQIKEMEERTWTKEHERNLKMVLFQFTQKLHEEIKNTDDERPNIVTSVK